VSSYGHFSFTGLQRDSQPARRRVDGWVGGWEVGCSAGWQGAAAVTPWGAAELHKEGWGVKEKQMLTIRSPPPPPPPSLSFWLVRGRKWNADIWVTYWILGINWRNVPGLVLLTGSWLKNQHAAGGLCPGLVHMRVFYTLLGNAACIVGKKWDTVIFPQTIQTVNCEDISLFLHHL